MMLVRKTFQIFPPVFDQSSLGRREPGVILSAEVDVVDVGGQTNTASLQLQVVFHRVYEFVRNLRRLQVSRTYSRDFVHRALKEGLDF
jgi:hypothetical protein